MALSDSGPRPAEIQATPAVGYRPLVDQTDALDRLAAARVGTLSTVRPDGGPHLVPVVFALHNREVVTAIDHKAKTTTRLQRLANIRSEPRVSLLAQHYSDNWGDLWWTRVDGPAEVLEHGPQFEAALEALAAKYEQYRRLLPSGPVIVIGVERVVGWAANEAD